MEQDSLSKFIKEIRRIWGSLDSDLVAKSKTLMEELATSSSNEPWLADIQGAEISRELFRDPEHGFILSAYTEQEGRYRAPHNHGNGWVIYAVQSGQMEMRTFARLPSDDTNATLVRRDKYLINKGEARAYLPGDIHDTRCVSSSVLVLRLTSLDLKIEKQEGRMNQYDDAK